MPEPERVPAGGGPVPDKTPLGRTDGPAEGLADLLESLAAIGRSMQEEFDPQRFLGEFSARLQRLVPHDRLVVDLLDEDGRTFTVFAEHAPAPLTLHQEHYTTAFHPGTRYVVAEWVLRRVFAGEALLVGDFPGDPRFEGLNPFERRLQEVGIRSGLLVPLESGGRTIGALVATALPSHAYGERHLEALRRVAGLIGPFIENVVLLQRERRRRRRLRALEGLTAALGAGLDVRGIFSRLVDALRPVLDFEVIGISLLSQSGRELETLAEMDDNPAGVKTPARIPLEEFSFATRVEAGETVFIHDAPRELDPSRSGDRLIIDDGGRSCLTVPLRFGERVGGGLYFGKRRTYWFDRSDAEIATSVAAHLVLAIQHQRLAEEERRLATVEDRAKNLERRLESLRGELDERYGFDHIIGRSPVLREVLARSAKVAPTEATVLLTGESGTGKELVARAVHHASLRADGPFVAINCAALPDTLLESELFGHERGAFTGADRQKPGRFEQAGGGTLFLDEIGELSPAVQAKLLRVLQEREFQRVGGTTTLKANVRLIAATNRDLTREVSAGRFRDDLYYRLNVFSIHLPALRERGEDVLLLADHFVQTIGARMAKADLGLSKDAREALLHHRWPGNIRELQNAVERALIVSDGGLLTAANFGIGSPVSAVSSESRPAAPISPLPQDSLPDMERRMVLEALEKARGNKVRAAALLGLTRSQLYTRLKRYGIAS
jgi:transcriptional regulator with GAF, ATPase, and Fis domain